MGWMNGLGFVTVEQISNRYQISKVTAYARLRKFDASEYVTHEKLLHNAPGHYRVTQKGVDLSDNELPPLKKTVISSYRHDQTVASLSVALEKHYGATFIPERALRREVGLRRDGSKGHISDGILKISERKIAIEVELSTKSKRRLNAIMSHYVRIFEYNEVWYFCDNKEVKNKIEKEMEKAGFVKAILISDILGKSRNLISLIN